MPKENYATIDDLAQMLGVKAQRAKQILKSYVTRGLLEDLTIRGKGGVKHRYPWSFVENIKALRENKVNPVEFTIPITIDNQRLRDILLIKFETIEAIQKIILAKLDEMVQPTMAQLLSFDTKPKHDSRPSNPN